MHMIYIHTHKTHTYIYIYIIIYVYVHVRVTVCVCSIYSRDCSQNIVELDAKCMSTHICIWPHVYVALITNKARYTDVMYLVWQ